MTPNIAQAALGGLIEPASSLPPWLVAAAGGQHPWTGEGPPFPFVLVPLFWLVLIAGATVAVVLTRRRAVRSAGAVAGQQKLAERYAAGELDDEEYRARRAVLREKP